MKNERVRNIWHRAGVQKLVAALFGTALFIYFLILFSDPYVSFILAAAVVIFSLLFLFIYISVMRPRRAFLLLAASGMIILALAGFAATSWQGSPISVQGFASQTNCVPIQIPNATSPSGYVNGARCTTSSNPFFNAIGLGGDFFFWFLVSGMVCFAMPVWEGGVSLNKITRNFFGAAVAAALIFLAICVPSEIPSRSLFAFLVPINPYTSFAICDSSTFFSGQCVSVNVGYLLVDYLFWVAVCSLAALTASESYVLLSGRVKRKPRQEPKILVSSEEPRK